jgi:hypothetical protein
MCALLCPASQLAEAACILRVSRNNQQSDVYCTASVQHRVFRNTPAVGHVVTQRLMPDGVTFDFRTFDDMLQWWHHWVCQHSHWNCFK